MKRLLLILTLLGSLNAAAQDDRSAKGGPHNLSAVASFATGGFNFGAAYEYLYQDSVGMGAHFRWFNKDDDANNSNDGLLIVGAGMGHHFYKKSWDLAFTPSLNIINIDSARRGGDDATVIGPGLSVSLICQMFENVALGFDWANYWAWFDDDYAGKRVDDLGIKVRMNF